MRSSYVELEMDDYVVVSGEVSKRDSSYDDAFGVVKQYEYDVKNLIIVAWIDGVDYELQDAIDPRRLERFRDKLIAKYEGSIS